MTLRLMVNMRKKLITVAQNGISMSRTEYIHATGKISKTIVAGYKNYALKSVSSSLENSIS
jgi:HSP90 family molecular chaperone